MRLGVLFFVLLTAGCATSPVPQSAPDAFLGAVQRHCGKAFEGRVVSNDAADADFVGKRLVMHVRTCAPGVAAIPFHVGEDRSRTWLVSRLPGGLRLKHDHRHTDGSPDVLTLYGGETTSSGTPTRQEFPVDAESIALFTRENRAVSTSNVWAMEITDTLFAYELRRPPIPGGRFFRVEFDLRKPVPPPPPPWGATP